MYAAYDLQARSAFYSFSESQRPMLKTINIGLTDHHFPASISSKLFTLFQCISFQQWWYQLILILLIVIWWGIPIHCDTLLIGDYQGQLSAISSIDFVSSSQQDKLKEGNSNGLKDLDIASWEDGVANDTSSSQTMPLQPSFLEILGNQGNQILGQLFTSNCGEREESRGHSQVQEERQV